MKNYFIGITEVYIGSSPIATANGEVAQLVEQRKYKQV
jgi:hypothetical protein